MLVFTNWLKVLSHLFCGEWNAPQFFYYLFYLNMNSGVNNFINWLGSSILYMHNYTNIVLEHQAYLFIKMSFNHIKELQYNNWSIAEDNNPKSHAII